MRKIVVSEFVTLDGVMEAPGTETSLGIRGGWSFKFWNEAATKYKHDELFGTDALLLGRVTYQIFADVWPSITDPQGFADRMNGLPKHVVSTTLKVAAWNNSRLITGNVLEQVSALKQLPGQDILILGSADLVRTLAQHDLIDEYRLMIFPIILGTGKRLFIEGVSSSLLLIKTDTFNSGIVVLSYQPVQKDT